MIVFTKTLKRKQLVALIGRGLTLRLFCNHHAPAESDGAGDYREPDSASGYEPALLSAWTIDDHAAASHEPHVFRFKHEAGTVRGAYLTDGDGELVGAGQFEQPVPVERQGGNLKVSPRLALGARG